MTTARYSGVAHLDIKWANLLFMDKANTHLVITDLGASKVKKTLVRCFPQITSLQNSERSHYELHLIAFNWSLTLSN